MFDSVVNTSALYSSFINDFAIAIMEFASNKILCSSEISEKELYIPEIEPYTETKSINFRLFLRVFFVDLQVFPSVEA